MVLGKQWVVAIVLAVTRCLSAQITGQPVSQLARFDTVMGDLLRRYEAPGGALAVSYKGRLVQARGYGFADREEGEPVQPDSLFRIASISKPVTAAAIVQLAGEGRLDLDAPAFALLPELMPAGQPADLRIRDVTVRQLLQHSGGWNRSISFDPMFATTDIARALGAPSPAACRDVVR
jgi:N-acyl-D-amino-acid deacylase